MSLRKQALRYGSLMLAALALGVVTPALTAGPAMAQVTTAGIPDTDPAFDDLTLVNQFVAALFPTLPAGTYQGNYVLTGATGTGLNSAITGGNNVFDPFASQWLPDLAKAIGLSGNAAFEAAFAADPSSIKVLGVTAVTGATVKWDGKYVYVNYTDTTKPGQFDLITNFGTFRSQVFANTTNVIAGDSSADVSGDKIKTDTYDVSFAKFLAATTNPNGATSKVLWLKSLTAGFTVKAHYAKGFARVKGAGDLFQIGWIAGNGKGANGQGDGATNTDYAVFTGYTQASKAGGTSSGFAF